jgi:hypothetical protein
MLLLSLVAFLLSLSGFSVLARSVLGKHGVAALERRGIDAHLWGYHLLSAGLVLALGTWVFRERSWGELSAVGHAALVAGGGWTVVALGLSAAAVLQRPHGPGWSGATRGRGGIPGPRIPPRRWSPAYRAFLASGLAVVLALAVLAV